MNDEIQPTGPHGKLTLPVNCWPCGAQITGGYAEGASAQFDWYNDKLQILVFDKDDEPALHVRYNPDGTIAEVIVRDDLLPSPWGYAAPIFWPDSSQRESQWQKERDGE